MLLGDVHRVEILLSIEIPLNEFYIDLLYNELLQKGERIVVYSRNIFTAWVSPQIPSFCQ